MSTRSTHSSAPVRITYVSRVRLNPYVRLLARGVKHVLPAADIRHSHFLSLPWLLRHLGQVDLLHIHWIEYLYRAPKAWQRRKGFLSVAAALILARLRGIRIVYTVHNLNQHEGRSPILNELANHLIFRLAHAVHVHDAWVAQLVAQRYHRREGVVVIPHGSYIGAYPDTTDREGARAFLQAKGIPVREDGFLFLFLGQVRPYKGLETLIAAFRNVTAPHAQLLIVGKAEDPSYAEEIRRLIRGDDRIITHLTYVADEELQYFFRAADVCVFPYRRITTSGAALLAFSFGCPIIAPALGPFRELAAGGRGLLYPPGDAARLAQRLQDAVDGALDRARDAVLAYARSLNWSTLGREHVHTYERVLCRPLAPDPEPSPLPPLVCAGRDPWEGPWRNRHQIMSRLSRHTPILYVEPRPYVRRVVREPLRHRWWPRAYQPSARFPDLRVVELPAWAARSGRGRALPDGLARRIVRGELGKLARCAPTLLHLTSPVRGEPPSPILWLTSPDQGDWLDLLPHRVAIYHVVDDYTAYEADYASPERLRYVQEQHRALLRRVDAVICTHPGLVEQVRPYNERAYLVPNGVDWPLYERALACPYLPPDVEDIPHPRLGYVGVLNDKIDIPLLRRLVDAMPEVHLVLVGPDELRHYREDAALLEHPRVHRLGFRSPEELPLYIRGLDVALMPYRLNRWTAFIDPLKLYEYMAVGLPVVATPIPAVERVRDLVYVWEGDVGVVERALQEDDPARRERRRAFARANSWENRVQQILRILQELRVNNG